MVARSVVSNTAAKQIFMTIANAEVVEKPEIVAERLGLTQVGDTAEVDAWVAAVFAERVDEVKRYNAGEVKLMGFFVGEVMKKSKGKADPKAVQARVRHALS
jgi:aspartyl-tRNA(Asn)/glutamyl-tRNA(Gln) amidotransferase subunit B